MNLNKEEMKKTTPKWLIMLMAVFFVLLIFSATSVLAFNYNYKDKIYPGIMIGENNFGGLTKDEARKKINKMINNYDKIGFIFTYQDEEEKIMPTITSFSGDIAIQAFTINAEKTIEDLYGIGRNNNFWQNWKNKIYNIFYPQKITAEYKINKNLIQETLKENFEKFETPAKNAQIKFAEKTGSEEKEIIITEEEEGQIINYKKGIELLEKNLKNLSNEKIILNSKNVYPQVYKKDIDSIKSEVEEIINRLPFKLQADAETWIIDKETFSSLITLKKESNEIIIDFDNEKLNSYLTQNISEVINVEPQNAKFEIENGVVTNFSPHKKGVKLDIENSISKIKEDFFDKKASSTKLIIKEAESEIKIDQINDLGIKEIIGIGESDFSGSPANRIHNIKNGSQKVSGNILEPGEEFSLVKTLGEVNAETGYLPELVIKGNETIPEYGGGLCQVATTLFRGALDSGLEITERRNHSYRVSYYEPAGTDATVYNPRPDLKFKNNTNNHILIQYRMSGNNLYFDFWGTKDGRKVEITKPTIYNITAPPPTKLIETLDLPPGKKRCTESAHSGADAYFDYKITYANGEISEERFTSHYIPWREVCLIGVEELTTEKESEEETNEEEIEKDDEIN